MNSVDRYWPNAEPTSEDGDVKVPSISDTPTVPTPGSMDFSPRHPVTSDVTHNPIHVDTDAAVPFRIYLVVRMYHFVGHKRYVIICGTVPVHPVPGER